MGARFRALSGMPSNALGAHYLYGADESFLLPRGRSAAPTSSTASTSTSATAASSARACALELFVDLFNIYNRQGTFGVDEPTRRTSARQRQNANPIVGRHLRGPDLGQGDRPDGVETSTR